MGHIALWVLVVFLPTAAVYLLIGLVRGGFRLSQWRRRPPPPEPDGQLEARLRRLRSDLEATEAGPAAAAKRHHVLAVRGAYLDTLREACARLDVTPPPGGD